MSGEAVLAGQPLWEAVVHRFDASGTAGARSSIDTQAELLTDQGVEFVIRLATALKSKPKGAAQPAKAAPAG
jgi:hypothetical protein